MKPDYSQLRVLRYLLAETAVIAAMVFTQATLVTAKTPREVARIAAPITVQINDNIGGGGSGVIISKSGHTYTVLTANHVVKRSDLTYTISTETGKTYPIIQVQRLQQSENGPDLALVTFESSDHYPLARLGNSTQAEIGSEVYVSGYPALEWQKSIHRDYEFSPGTITSRLQSAPAGYTLRYNAETVSGMSGSPVFDVEGRVVGIHGEGETIGTAQSESGRSIPIKTGFNAGIPINTFVALRAQTGLISSKALQNNHSLISTRPPQNSHPIAARNVKARRLSRSQSVHIPHNFALAYYQQGNSLSIEGKDREAIRSYTEAIQLNPKDPFAYYNRGETRYKLGDKQGAIQDYQQAIRLGAKFALVYNNLGMAHYQLGDKQGAIKDYLQAIRLSRKFALAYNNLGMARYQLGDTLGAIRDYNQAIRFLPRYATAYYNRGAARYQIGDKQGAISDYNQAIRLSHDYNLAYYHRGAIRTAMESFRPSANGYEQASSADKRIPKKH
ncbi:MAG: serine protease [Chroococcidiopsidaceae cyanobacterium CP_BM_ER_R8_30]|nr:serine protease [Chroococcidiopsidaceae cyanobacterium CP_BM_ER_R8_30]